MMQIRSLIRTIATHWSFFRNTRNSGEWFQNHKGIELSSGQLFVIAFQNIQQRLGPWPSEAMHNYKPDEEDPSWSPHEAVVLLPSAAVYVLHQKATVTVSTDRTLA